MAIATCVAVIGSATALAAGAPGTATQVKSDVTNSLSIDTLPSSLKPDLAVAGKDTPYATTPSLSACNTLGTTINLAKCHFGDQKGTKTMVLWGDSHAFMWFPAVNAVAKASHWRLVPLLKYGCPVAWVSVWNPLLKTPYKSCDTFRSNMIAAINKLNPSLVVMTQSFTSQAANAGGASGTISTTQWRAGLARTLRALHAPAARKVVLGSTVSSGNMVTVNPPACLAVFPTQVQKCTIPDTVAQQSERAAEVAAAKSVGVAYVNVLPWLCSSAIKPTSCAAIIGSASSGYRVVYYSTGHMTQTYATYLSGVLGATLKSRMR